MCISIYLSRMPNSRIDECERNGQLLSNNKNMSGVNSYWIASIKSLEWLDRLVSENQMREKWN